MGIFQACYVLAQFLASVIIARLMSPFEVGVYAVAFSITGLLGAVQGLGLTGFIVREADLADDLKSTTYTINLILNLCLAAAIGGIGLVAGALMHQDEVAQILGLLAVVPLLGIFEFLPAAMIERAGNFKYIAIIGSVRTVMAQSTTVLLAYGGMSSRSFAWGQIAGALFTAIAYNVAGRRDVRPRLRFSDFRRVASFGAQMLTINGLNMLAARLSEIALARIAGLGALGLFFRASGINNLAWENIHVVAGRVLLVRFSAIRSTGSSLRSYYLHVLEMLTALLWPAFLGLAIVSGPFILAVYGPNWVAAAQPLALLALASAVHVSITMAWELFVVCGETRRQSRIEVARTAVGTGLFAAGAFLAGLTGAAAGRLADALFSACVYRRPIDQMTGTRFSDLLPVYLKSFLLACVAVTPAAAVMGSHHGAATAPLAEVAAGIAAGVIAWAVVLLVIDHPLALETRRLLRRVRQWQV
jgi:O-antigen/teichoic acid export membrane protein